MICATLTDDYTAVSDEYSVHCDGLYPPYTREAPAYFERKGKKYLFTSGTSGFFPNATRVYSFDEYHGEYTDLGDPCIGDKTNTTFNSQITSVIKIEGKQDLYVACADRWLPGIMATKMSKAVISGMEKRYRNYQPDTSPKEVLSLSGEETKKVLS